MALSEEECEEAEEGCNSRSVSPAPDQGGPEHSGSIGQDTAEYEAAKEQKQAERETARQKVFDCCFVHSYFNREE